MTMMIVLFLLFGLIDHVSSIECYTCNFPGYYCPVPLYLDAGDESNENPVVISSYDIGYACQSDHSFDPSTGAEIIILRGIDDCEDVDEINHRVFCCYTDHCNRKLPEMTSRTLADLMPSETGSESSTQRHISSISLITIADLMPSETRSESSTQRHISSISLITIMSIFQYFLLN